MVTSETEAQAVLERRCSEEKTVGGGPGKSSTSRLNIYNTVFRSGHLWESRTRVCLCVSIFERPFFCSINIDDHRLIQVGNWTEKANCAQYLSTPAVFFFDRSIVPLSSSRQHLVSQPTGIGYRTLSPRHTSHVTYHLFSSLTFYISKTDVARSFSTLSLNSTLLHAVTCINHLTSPCLFPILNFIDFAFPPRPNLI